MRIAVWVFLIAYVGFMLWQLAGSSMFTGGTSWVLPVVVSVSLGGIALWADPQIKPWSKLCDAFPVREEYAGKWLNFQTMKFGPLWNLASCVAIGLGADSLNLKLWGFPFSKKIQIPWSEISEISEQPMDLYSNIQFVLRNGEPLTFFYSAALRSLLTSVIPAIGQSHLLKTAEVL